MNQIKRNRETLLGMLIISISALIAAGLELVAQGTSYLMPLVISGITPMWVATASLLIWDNNHNKVKTSSKKL